MAVIQLIHAKPDLAKQRIQQLEEAGFEVRFEPFSPALMQALKQAPPDLVVIDLERVPSQGRDVGVALRVAKSTRHTPLVFAGGTPAKRRRVKETLPDAVFALWEEIADSLVQALSAPVRNPVVPQSTMAGYSGTPLPKKLGIRPGSLVNLIGAPKGFGATLGDLPDGASLRTDLFQIPPDRHTITLWFVRSKQTLEKQIRKMARLAAGGGLWIIWAKKASPLSTDVSQTDVRQTGLDSGLVDFKICSVDKDWSGLQFAVRKPSPK